MKDYYQNYDSPKFMVFQGDYGKSKHYRVRKYNPKETKKIRNM